MKSSPVFVTKSSGYLTEFSPEKLRSSLIRAGAGEAVADKIVHDIRARLYPSVSTRKIYRWAMSLLKKNTRPAAARYNLKNALMELGPSGFPFENYIAALFRFKGFKTRVGEIAHGLCVDHEIDVIAENETTLRFMECKYHNLRGVICDVKIPLYISARFRDVESYRERQGQNEKTGEGWIVTNTRFSNDALKFGNCAGLKLLGWDYPLKNSLRELIDQLRLYPVTCMTTLTQLEKQRLLHAGIVLCRELDGNENILAQNGFRAQRIAVILNECRALCTAQEITKQEEISA
jgi:hypothetical protein